MNQADAIRQKLREIEAANQVKILYAVESGSRAWGFASPDSDYDVRYVFIRPIKDYLRIDPLPDHIDGPLDEVQDYSGWDVKKALGLLGKSNPSLLEWLHSPVVYAQTAAWRHFADCADAYFSVERNLHHQYASAHSTWRNFLQGEQVRLKKYLYALRPLLCFRYVEQYRKVAPVPFDELCAAVLPDSMRGAVDDLLAQKKQAREKETAPRIPELDAYLLAEFAHAEQVLEALPNPAAPDLGRLNVIFQTMLAETSDDFQNFPNSDE